MSSGQKGVLQPTMDISLNKPVCWNYYLIRAREIARAGTNHPPLVKMQD